MRRFLGLGGESGLLLDIHAELGRVLDSGVQNSCTNSNKSIILLVDIVLVCISRSPSGRRRTWKDRTRENLRHVQCLPELGYKKSSTLHLKPALPSKIASTLYTAQLPAKDQYRCTYFSLAGRSKAHLWIIWILK